MTYSDLKDLGIQYDQTQKLRIATENRLKHIEPGSNVADLLVPAVALHKAFEADLSKHMQKILEEIAHPRLVRWQQESNGVGLHLLARLLGETGDPTVAIPQWWEGEGENRQLLQGIPYKRTPQQFFRYCGYGDPDDKRRKGMSAEEVGLAGRPRAKKVGRLLAESCMRQRRNGSPYCWVYDHWKPIYATRDGWTRLHQHNATLRKVVRALLLDTWLTAQGLEPIYGHGDAPGKFNHKVAV